MLRDRTLSSHFLVICEQGKCNHLLGPTILALKVNARASFCGDQQRVRGDEDLPDPEQVGVVAFRHPGSIDDWSGRSAWEK